MKKNWISQNALNFCQKSTPENTDASYIWMMAFVQQKTSVLQAMQTGLKLKTGRLFLIKLNSRKIKTWSLTLRRPILLEAHLPVPPNLAKSFNVSLDQKLMKIDLKFK